MIMSKGTWLSSLVWSTSYLFLVLLVLGWSGNDNDALVVQAQQDETTNDDCSIVGASYGYPSNMNSNVEWATIVGLACGDTEEEWCYQQASAWSEVAVRHGNRPVMNAQECRTLCQTTEKCDVWNYWPDGVGVVNQDAKCDICPESEGGVFDRARGYCLPDGGDCGLCGDVYDFFAQEGVPEGEDYTCSDVTGFFASAGCCTFDEELKRRYQPRGACELLSSSVGRDDHDMLVQQDVLVFHDLFEIITGPKDCQTTKWLPFLQTTVHPKAHEISKIVPEIDYEEKGYCDPCPSAYGLVLLGNNTFEEVDEETGEVTVTSCSDAYMFVTTIGIPDVSCRDIANWMREEGECCDWTNVLPEYARNNDDNDDNDGEEDPLATFQTPEGFCDPCPRSNNYTLHPEVTYEEESSPNGVATCADAYNFITQGFLEDIPCQDLVFWMLYESLCCSAPTTETPTAAPTQVDTRPKAQDGRLCWIQRHTYGVQHHGACDDAHIVAVYASNSTIALGYHQGWWDTHDDNVTTSHMQPIPYDDDFTVTDCYMACMNHDECGGWEVRDDGTCLLKSILDCSPTLGLDPSSTLSTMAGIKGCIDAESSNVQERNAVDTSDFWYLNCDLPRCTVPLTNGYSGLYAGDTYIPSSNCWYKQYTPEELYQDCTKDRWIVINGGSNTLSFYAQMVNLFAPVQTGGENTPLIGFEETLTYSIIDLVFRGDGLPILDAESPDILYSNLKMMCEIVDELSCDDEDNQFSLTFHGGRADWPESYVKAIQNTLAEAPHEPGATRVTLIVGQLWTNAEAALKAVSNGGAGGWENAKVLYYGQAMIWYPCNLEGWCDLEDLGSTDAELFAKYSNDLDGVMEVGKTTCATDRFDCFFATHAYGGSSLGGKAREMIRILEEKTAVYDWAHFIDYNTFTFSEEVVDGHVTPYILLTVKTMMWNTICPGPDRGCPEAIETTPSCWSDCDERGGGAECGYFCNDWLCMNERQCDHTRLDPVPWEVLTAVSTTTSVGADATCFDALEIGSRYSATQEGTARRSHCHKRIWCSNMGAGWAVGLLVFFLGLLAVLAPYFVKRNTDSQPSSTAKEGNDPEKGGTAGSTEALTPDQASAEVSSPLPDDAADGVGGVKAVATPTPRKKEHLASLGMARLIASQHIVVGHLYAEGAVSNTYFFQWGYTWVPWFFVLSGYVLTHARLNSRDPSQVDGPYCHVAKRLSTIFPMYAFGVFVTMIIRVANDLRLPDIEVLLGQSFLLQAWVPSLTEKALLSQCWFLSGLLVYWGIYKWLYKLLRQLTFNWTVACLVFVCFLPWLSIIVPSASDEIEIDWYRQHRWADFDTPEDIWTVMLKFHPIFYVHVFVFGMLLAILRHHLKDDSNTSLLAQGFKILTQVGATLGYLGLILMFTVEGMKPASHKLSARLSVLLPLQGAMMLGLSPLPSVVEATGFQDPLAILFSYTPSWIGDVSYCQYVLQFIMYDLFPTEEINDPSFFLYLWGGSLLAYKLIQEPAAKLWRSLLPKQDIPAKPFLPSLNNAGLIFIPPVILAVVLSIAKGSHIPASGVSQSNIAFVNGDGTNTTNSTFLPPFVRLAPEAVDMKLNWTMEDDSSGASRPSSINPSMLFLDDGSDLHWVRAVRTHALEEEIQAGVYEGEAVTEQVMKFHSSILLAEEPFAGNLDAGFDDAGILQWGLDGSSPLASTSSSLISHNGKNADWSNLCEPQPSFKEDDKWLVRKLVSGPEDPKLFHADSSWAMTYSSFPPAAVMTDGSSAEECRWKDTSVMQMYVAFDGPTLVSGKPVLGTRLKYGKREDTEKNWIAFTHDGSLYYIYSVEPHVVVEVRSTDGAATRQYATSSPQMKAVADSVYAIRGSATAARYSETEYLALMHIYDPLQGYSTVAYTFDTAPPFAVRRISKPLPLQAHSFASSLVLQSNKVLIGYGEADKSSRVLVMSEDHLEHQYFDWCS